MPLFHLLYLSRTRLDWSEQELAALVSHAQQRNARDGLTGLLLYGNGHFLQLLEGRRQPLLLTYNRIARDDRHTDVQLLLDGRVSRRTFDQWAMGLLNMHTAGDVDRDRFDRIIRAFTPGAAPVTDNALALLLLKEFRAHVSEQPPSRLPDLA